MTSIGRVAWWAGAFGFVLSGWIGLAAAQPVPSTIGDQLVIPRAQSEVELDGHVDEAAWDHARKLPVAQHQPNFGAPPTERTEILITFDEDYIYAACRCYDTGTPSVSSFKRDYIDGDSDLFALILDTFHDDESAVAFLTAPSGLRGDLAVSNDGAGPAPLDVDWNTFWTVATRQTRDGWFAEMRIPVSSLRFQAQGGTVVMGLSAGRLIARKSEDIVFPAIPPNWGATSRWKVSEFEEISFEGLAPRPPLRVTPYVLGGVNQRSARTATESGYEAHTDYTSDIGVDVKYGLSSNITLDLTVNTDFAQVEVDNQQVNLTRFPLFFPEKRRFFKERASTFAFNFGSPNRLFYSRRIGLVAGRPVRILGGARVVGRVGAWDVGLLNMQTAARSEGEDKARAAENMGVLRVQRQVLNVNSTVGGILTSRVGLDGTYNVAYGLDGLFRVRRDDYVTVRWAQTFEDQRSTALTSFDPARVQILWERRSFRGFNYALRFARAGATYEPGLGFELREDYFRFGDRISYGWLPGRHSLLQRHRISIDGSAYFRNADRSLETLRVGPTWEGATDAGHSFRISAVRVIENLRAPFTLFEDIVVPAKRYGFQEAEVTYGMPAGWPVRANMTASGGTFYDGYRTSFEISPTWNVSRYLRASATYQINRVRFPDRDRELTTHVQRVRLDITPHVDYSISGFVQYNSADNLLAGNVRFRYNPRQGNDLFLVYNEQLNTNRDATDPRLPITDRRSVMLKYTYTFNWQ